MSEFFIQRCALYFVLLWCCMLAMPADAATSLRVFGVNKEQKQQIKLAVGAPTHDSERSIKRFIDALPAKTRTAMAALGYYRAEVLASRSVSREGDFIDIRITRNDPVRINEIKLMIEGDARKDGEFMRTLGGLPLRRNAVFLSEDYEAAKSRLIDAAQDLGYFDFDFTTKRVRVSREQLTADVDLVANSGQRYTFGKLSYDQTEFTEIFLQRWTPFSEGDPYQSSQIAVAVANLQASGYFSSVRVLPQRDERYGKTVPVRIELVKKDDNLVGLGIGYATDTGARAKITWGRPLLNRFGHSLDLQFGVSEVNQTATASYKIPRRKQPLYNYFAIEYGLKNEDTDEKKSFLTSLSFQRVRRLSSMWDETAFIRLEREENEIGDDPKIRTDLVLPGVSWSRSRSKGKPFTTFGQSTTLQFLYGSRGFYSTVDLLKSVFNFKYIRAVSNRNTFLFSVQYGAISTNDFNRVPTSQRFFAGGDRSIRGFRYRDVAPRNSDDVVIGGRYLEAISLEHNYRIRDRWSSAIFVDAGRAFNDFATPHSVGAGIGVRWQSPVGPFRLDVGYPISEVDDPQPRLHLSLGPDL